MNRILYLLTLSLVFLGYQTLNAQDKILLLNGKSYEGEFLSKSEDLVNFNFVKKSGKVKPFSFERIRVYSYTKNGEQESVLYQRDTSIFHYYSQYEMRLFIYGENDAYNRYKVTRPWLTGFAIGLGVSLYDTYLNEGYTCPDGIEVSKGFFKRQPSLAQIIVPFVVPITTGAIKPKMKARFASDPTFLANEYYIEGFKKVRRFRRVKASLLGTLCGVASGMLAYYITPKPC
ncbi:MAG: hypothetical protein N4A35_09790 [Flavobacteriales bacterium]|jgi:hypothetical protein|nr:hypothetical protein [Flavobacteriales bacterium]